MATPVMLNLSRAMDCCFGFEDVGHRVVLCGVEHVVERTECDKVPTTF